MCFWRSWDVWLYLAWISQIEWIQLDCPKGAWPPLTCILCCPAGQLSPRWRPRWRMRVLTATCLLPAASWAPSPQDAQETPQTFRTVWVDSVDPCLCRGRLFYLGTRPGDCYEGRVVYFFFLFSPLYFVFISVVYFSVWCNQCVDLLLFCVWLPVVTTAVDEGSVLCPAPIAPCLCLRQHQPVWVAACKVTGSQGSWCLQCCSFSRVLWLFLVSKNVRNVGSISVKMPLEFWSGLP